MDENTTDEKVNLQEEKLKLEVLNKTEMNFGGGVAYLFDCSEAKNGKFLWQC